MRLGANITGKSGFLKSYFLNVPKSYGCDFGICCKSIFFYRITKRHYGNWTQANIEKALKACRAGTMGFSRSYSETYKIPKLTLKRHLDGRVLRENSGSRLNGRLPTLQPEVENKIIVHIIKLESYFFGITITGCTKLAYGVAEKARIWSSRKSSHME
jgi:hypothetical protein